MSVIRAGADQLETDQEQFVFTITDGGFAKRSRIEYRTQSRGGLGVKSDGAGAAKTAADSRRCLHRG
ncbi:MAG: hypothetical protein R2709_10760 [Marmoricola sp.]